MTFGQKPAGSDGKEYLALDLSGAGEGWEADAGGTSD